MREEKSMTTTEAKADQRFYAQGSAVRIRRWDAEGNEHDEHVLDLSTYEAAHALVDDLNAGGPRQIYVERVGLKNFVRRGYGECYTEPSATTVRYVRAGSAPQPAPDAEGEWRVVGAMVVNESGRTVAKGHGSTPEQRRRYAARIVSDHAAVPLLVESVQDLLSVITHLQDQNAITWVGEKIKIRKAETLTLVGQDGSRRYLYSEIEHLLKTQGLLVEALKFVDQFFQNLEDGGDENDPLTAMRRKYHAPVRAKIAAAFASVRGETQ